MTSPVCVKCQRIYRTKTNGVPWVETRRAEPDADVSEYPYKLWHSDLLECPGCGHQILAAHGMKPLSEQHDKSFALAVASWGATINAH